MVKVEMEYNPYLKETKIKFNGKKPRINSQVEKYESCVLQTWVDKVPSIFYDEMNGYDFELEFSGTELDYLDLKNVFEKNGIDDDTVHIFKKNDLDERTTKIDEIEELLLWLKGNKNHYFDDEQFIFINRELLEETYPFFVLHGISANLGTPEEEDVLVEYINSVDEIKVVNLEFTPIAIYVDSNSIAKLETELSFIKNQPNVMDEQLFFIIDPSLNSEFVIRLIKDLGINNPNVVDSLNDKAISKFIQVYPITDYINKAIIAFNAVLDKISYLLSERKTENEINNRSNYTKLNNLNRNIENLKKAHNTFVQKDNIEIPYSWIQNKEELFEKIRSWRIKKTKIAGDMEIQKAASEFEKDVKYWYGEFIDSFKLDVMSTLSNILSEYRMWYKDGGYDTYYILPSRGFNIINVKQPLIQGILETLTEMKSVETVQNKGVFGLFFNPIDDGSEIMTQNVAYYQKWREAVEEMVKNVVDNYIQDVFIYLKGNLDSASKTYEDHISDLLKELTEKRNNVSSQLSEEEKDLQCDIEWLANFADQVKQIERG